MDGRGGVDPGGVGGKNFSAAFGGRKIYPRGGGAWVGGSKKIFLARGYFTNKNGLKFFHPGGDFGKNGLPGGVKNFRPPSAAKNFTTPHPGGSNVLGYRVGQNFRRGVPGPPHHPPPRAHVWSRCSCLYLGSRIQEFLFWPIYILDIVIVGNTGFKNEWQKMLLRWALILHVFQGYWE